MRDRIILLYTKKKIQYKYFGCRIFNSLLGVSSGDETLHLMLDILNRHCWKESLKVG